MRRGLQETRFLLLFSSKSIARRLADVARVSQHLVFAQPRLPNALLPLLHPCLCSTVDSTNRPSCHKGLKTAHSATIPSVYLFGFGRICSLPSRSLFDLLSICQHAVSLLRRSEEGRHRLSVVIRCTSTFVSQAYLLPRNRLCHI
jgi:hypothetical protein